jgi:F-type H+-transporting ATPase subunit c
MGLSFLNVFSSLLLAADAPAGGSLIGVNGLLAIGIGIAVLGGAKGIGAIGSSAVESIARQPEAGGRIFTSMIISAALIEGFTFFALVICMLAKQ